MQVPSDSLLPRLCIIHKKTENEEYGFNLHAEHDKGQFVGAVDENSASAVAGLKTGDRIFGVNGELILDATHKEV